MPQMGESIVEGTIVRWHRAVGDIVERDDPLFDIATDKVDTEVPAALNGRLAEILVSEGETVEVNTVVARIVAEGEAWPPEEPSGSEREAPPAADEDSPDRPDPGEAAPEPSPRRRRPRSSPLVRRIAREHRVDLAEMTGTGDGGRVSKKDILSFLDRRKEAPETAEAPATDVSVPLVVPELVVPELPPRPSEDTSHRPVGSRTEPLSRMRRSIAEHMVQMQAVPEGRPAAGSARVPAG